MKSCFCPFLIKILQKFVTLAAQLMRHSHMCAPMNSFHQPIHTAPSVFKYTSGKSQLCSKQSSNEPSPVIFMAVGGCFECYTHYGTSLAEERRRRKKLNNSDFLQFQVCHFKIVTTHRYYYCRLGQAP